MYAKNGVLQDSACTLVNVCPGCVTFFRMSLFGHLLGLIPIMFTGFRYVTATAPQQPLNNMGFHQDAMKGIKAWICGPCQRFACVIGERLAGDWKTLDVCFQKHHFAETKSFTIKKINEIV